MTSKPFYCNDITVNNIILNYEGDPESVQFGIGTSTSYAGTFSWEDVNVGENRVLSTPNKWVKWRVLGRGGSLTKISIKINP